jgi:DNA-binding MurR/RpiR family transcriptional regulator
MKASAMPLAKSMAHDLLEVLASSLPTLTTAENRIATWVLENPEATTASGITRLAQSSGVSEASVLRFCRSLGFSGYPDFRIALAAELGRRVGADDGDQPDGGITEDDSLAEIVRKIGRSDAKAIESTVARLDIDALKAVVDACQDATMIGVIGVGASSFVALDLQLKLNRLGRRCIAWTDSHTALTSMATLTGGDLLIAITHSGATTEVLDVIRAFQETGATTATITNNPRSAAAQKADLLLLTSAGESPMRSGATASRLAQLTVVDCLCIALAHRDIARTRAALGKSRAAVDNRFASEGQET